MSKKACCSAPVPSPLPQISKEGEKRTYAPLYSVFAVSLGIALSIQLRGSLPFSSLTLFHHFVAVSMCILGVLKLQDLQAFATSFEKYDLLAKRVSGYAVIYPLLEIGLGLLMLSSVATIPVAVMMILISVLGITSIINSLYFKKESLQCACVGGGKNVPLGSISIIENAAMLVSAGSLFLKL